MKTKNLFLLWGGCYIFCMLLSFIPTSGSAVQVLFSLCSAGFFIPGILLLFRGMRQNDKRLLLQLRLISGLSLLLTGIVLLANFLSVTGSETLGNILYVLLLIVSVPMAISGFWLLPLFAWACLFMATFVKKP